MKSKYRSGLPIFFLPTIVFLIGLGACEKAVKYNVPLPPEGNTLELEATKTFDILSRTKNWIWNLPSGINVTNYKSLALFSEFDKDSTSDFSLLIKKSLRAQLSSIYSSGSLTDAQEEDITTVYNSLSGVGDGLLRDWLTQRPDLVNYLNAVLTFLPNFMGFNSLELNTLDTQVHYTVGGPIQLSMTFNNSNALAKLKEDGLLDFDFRIMKATKDSFKLSGYYNQSKNQNLQLYPSPDDDLKTNLKTFMGVSNIIIAFNPLRSGVATKMDGNIISVPGGYHSGLHYFYAKYNQQFITQAGKLGFVPSADSIQSSGLFKDIKFMVAKSFYSGAVRTAPAGTIIASLEGVSGNGSQHTIEFIKN